MIKFFRHIRQTLLMENKTSKYFKYAIGEIVLVVIGILIALQINNWNDEKKENKELNSYLAKISNNIQLDITTLKDLKTRRLQVVEDCKKAVLNFQNNTFDLKTNLKAANVFIDFYFTPNQSGYDALKNSSYLGKINDTKVDSLLDNYNKLLNITVKEESSYLVYLENMEVLWSSNHDSSKLISIYINQETINFEELDSNTKRILQKTFSDKVFLSSVTRGSFQLSTLKYYDELMRLGEEVIKEIEVFTND